jgi:hypothetical protein
MGSAFARLGASLILISGLIVVAVVGAPAASGPRWSALRTPSPPGPPNGLLTGVACISPTNCFAIGRDNTQPTVITETLDAMHGWRTPRSRAGDTGKFRRWNGAACATPVQCLARKPAVANGHVTITISGPDTLLEHWNGSTWAFVPGPPAPNNGVINLLALSCPAANSCFAVGSLQTVQGEKIVAKTVIEQWNGSTWSIASNPSPANALAAELNSISCVSPTSCVAVGDYLGGNFNSPGSIAEHALVQQWDGASWTSVAAPIPAGSKQEFLAGVSCADASNCLAAGASLTATATKPLALRRSGATWSVLNAPIPAGEDAAGFVDVACSSATACTLVGGAFTGTGADELDNAVPLAERWNGTSLTTQPVPSSAPISELSTVACPAATDCSAGGFAFDGDDDESPVNVHWNGSSWSVAPSPVSTPFFELVDMACTSSSLCFAVGDSAIVEQWNGTTWSLAPFAAKSSQSGLADIACMTETSCVAVGWFAENGGPQPLAEMWNGKGWRSMMPPVSAGQPNAELVSVACSSATNCTAVGSAGDAGPVKTLVERWNGTTWSVVPSPTPTGAAALELIDVSCGGPQRCNALGIIYSDDDSQLAFAEHWNGSKWSIDPLPISIFASYVELESLSCVSPTSCFAVGAYEVATGSRELQIRTLLLHWNGSRWQQMKPPKLASPAKYVVPSSVSCSSPNQCLAIGSALVSRGAGRSLDLKWDGKGWTEVAGGGSPPIDVSSLACRSNVSCYAVGTGFSFSSEDFEEGPGVAHWNGRSWAPVSAETPAGANSAAVFGVACPSRRVCFAAGSSSNVLGSFTLVLRGT